VRSKVGHHELAALIFVSFGKSAQDRNAGMYPYPLFLLINSFGISEIGVACLKNDIERRNPFPALTLQNFLHEVNQAKAKTKTVVALGNLIRLAREAESRNASAL
jgi:hypothetical protein